MTTSAIPTHTAYPIPHALPEPPARGLCCCTCADTAGPFVLVGQADRVPLVACEDCFAAWRAGLCVRCGASAYAHGPLRLPCVNAQHATAPTVLAEVAAELVARLAQSHSDR